MHIQDPNNQKWKKDRFRSQTRIKWQYFNQKISKYLSIKIDESLTWNVHINDNGIKINRYITILANSSNTKCQPFHVKINCSKFRIDRLQQLCQAIFLIYLFVSSRNYYCLVYISKENYYNFRQMSLEGVLLSISVLECFSKTF